ncbi:uncharacterized protein LOC133306727 [Gastrolobium bilobum]|uniref:uncharacterized protein LOC133306727 n=1 Tax=Gastrolobium bilobum TaxID=150636 RepID=UPI002AB19C97|nr:uncharacterized protein LOC133306727 [Gastrolobium bilobum]
MAAKGFKTYLGVCVLLVIIIVGVIVIITQTMFKLKDPDINLHPVGLDKFDFFLLLNSTKNVTLGMMISIKNPNYGTFKYKNSTGYVNYDNTIVAEVPIEGRLVQPHSKMNLSTHAYIMPSKLVNDPQFFTDVGVGTLNLTSKAELHGKVSLMKVIKMKATAYSSCNISLNISSKDVDTKCISKIKL